MKLNELVCPSCGLKCMTDCAYTTCDGCGAHFTAAQSRSRDNPAPYPAPGTITWPTILPNTQPYIGDPPIGIQPIWIAPYGPPGTPYGPTVICEGGTGQVTSQASSSLQVTN